MLSKGAFGVAAAGAGLGFLAYCIYFDHKRRSDPLFKQKLRERRRKQKQSVTTKGGSSGQLELPDLRDPEATQKFFLQEVQLGEELLATGDIEAGVDHLSHAVAVCGQPQQLLQVLQQTLPPQVFQLLIQRLPQVSQRIASSAMATGVSSGNTSGGPTNVTSPQPTAVLLDDDLE